MGAKHYEPYRHLAERGELNIRVFWLTIRQPATPEQVDKVLAEIPQQKPFQGNDYFDQIGWGESIYGPVTTNSCGRRATPGRRTSRSFAASRRRSPSAACMSIRTSRWKPRSTPSSTSTRRSTRSIRSRGCAGRSRISDQVTEAQLERMKRLGMSAQIHSRPLIQGALMHKVHGDKAWDMPPFRRVQDSGIPWGLGSDATAVTTSNPFYTLGLAVTGRMVGGRHVNRQTITREEALIAHTRANARLPVPGQQPRLAGARQVCRSPGARPRLSHRAGGRDQGHQAAAHHGGRQDRLRCANELTAGRIRCEGP